MSQCIQIYKSIKIFYKFFSPFFSRAAVSPIAAEENVEEGKPTGVINEEPLQLQSIVSEPSVICEAKLPNDHQRILAYTNKSNA